MGFFSLILSSLVMLVILCTILVYTVQTFLGLAVYHDAKARNIDMAVMWGVLTGFFGLIPAIIYLVIRSRNKSSVKCPRCFAQVFHGMPACPVCQLPVDMIPSMNPAQIMKHRKLAKGFLISAIVLTVLIFLSILALTLIIMFYSFSYTSLS